MKKIFRLIAALAATTVAFSCLEEANPEIENVSSEKVGTHYEGPMTTLEFSVDTDLKTSYNKEDGHQWSEGDQIKIIWGPEDDAFVVAEVINGTVSAEVGDVDTYYAVYPETTEYILEAEEGETEPTLTARIERYQDGSFKSANVMAAKTTKAKAAFAFKNLTHIIRFNLEEGHGFKALEIAPNSEDIITGRYFVDINDNEVSLEYNSKGTTNSKYITLSNIDNKSGAIYVGLVPGADMSTGIALRGRKATDEEFRYFALSTNPIETKRSAITNIKGNLNEFLKINEYYIAQTSKGTGDGSSWANAAGISKFMSLLNKIQLGTDADGKAIYSKSMHQWRIQNANIHIAAGEYNLPATNGNASFKPNGMTKYVNFKVIGGYPSEPSEGAVQDLKSNQTIFTTINKNNVRILHFENAEFEGIVFDGITFKGLGETAVSSVGVGTYFSGSTAGAITYKNCKFTEFNNSNNGSNGAIFLANSSGTLSLNFTNCEFSNNTTASSGMVTLAQAKTTTTFTDCTFTSNTSTTNGGAIYCTAGVVDINGTSFSENSATNGGAVYNNGGTITFDNSCNFASNSATSGGAFYSKTGTTNINGTSFSENSATNGGAFYHNGGTAVINNGCTFTSNSATDNHGGAIYVNGPDKELTIKNSVFTSNTAKYGGAIANSVGILIVDGCSFTSNHATEQGGALISFDAKLVSGYGEISSGKKASLYVYNSSFDKNIAKAQGAAIKAHGSGYLAVVNSTYASNDCQNNSGGIIRLRNGASTGVTAWIINSTSNNPNTTRIQHSITNQASTYYCYNSVLLNETTAGDATKVTKEFYGTILGTALYNTDGTKSSTAVTFADQIGTFANGVFPVKSGSAAATSGMSATELAALGSTVKAAMPLFDESKLTVDQKGNARTGNVMGAYVGE